MSTLLSRSRCRVPARRALALLVGLTLTATTGVAASSPATGSSDAATTSTRATLTPTAFALQGAGFGSRVLGGEIPADSRTTAFQALGCSNKAGRDKANHEAELTVPGLGLVSGVATTVRTTRRDGVVASTSTQRIASIQLAEAGLGSVSIEALRSRARAFHDAQGFDSTATTDIGRIVFQPAVGDPQVLPLPTAGEPVVVPGLAEIELGQRRTTSSRGGASARATALLIHVVPSGTTATVGLARAKIGGGVQSVLFRGQSYGLRAEGLDDNLGKGRSPLSLMPCQGTGGAVQDKALAGVDLGGQIEVGAVTSAQMARQQGDQARGWERGQVASISLGDGQLVIEGIVGQANVRKDGGRPTYDARGTTLGSVTFDGEPQTFPDTGVLEVPGVARLERQVVTRKRNAISVIALRITLLDGSLATIDLGNATVGSTPSGR
jgi:hypothetical protein